MTLERALNLDSESPLTLCDLGVSYLQMQNFPKAKALFERALQLDPDYVEANFNLALSYLQRTPPAVELARRHYYRAIDLGAAPDPLVEKSLGDDKK